LCIFCYVGSTLPNAGSSTDIARSILLTPATVIKPSAATMMWLAILYLASCLIHWNCLLVFLEPRVVLAHSSQFWSTLHHLPRLVARPHRDLKRAASAFVPDCTLLQRKRDVFVASVDARLGESISSLHALRKIWIGVVNACTWYPSRSVSTSCKIEDCHEDDSEPIQPTNYCRNIDMQLGTVSNVILCM